MGISLIFQPGLLKDTVERGWLQVIGGFSRHRNPTLPSRTYRIYNTRAAFPADIPSALPKSADQSLQDTCSACKLKRAAVGSIGM